MDPGSLDASLHSSSRGKEPLVVYAGLPADTVAQPIALAKSKRGERSYAASGVDGVPALQAASRVDAS